MAFLFAVCGRAQNGATPLHTAAFSGHLECVRLLLERGADKEAKTKVRTPTRATAAARCVGAPRQLLSLCDVCDNAVFLHVILSDLRLLR